MSKAASFSNFRPSFITAGLGWLPELFEEAYRDGAPKISAQLGEGGGEFFTADGVVGAGKSRSLRFGHARRADPMDDDLSGAAPYLLLVQFKDDAIEEINLKLILPNPRMIVANELFSPAIFNRGGDPANHFDALTADPVPCGFALLHEPNAPDPAEQFAQLSDGMSATTLGNSNPPGYLAFEAGTLVGRIDLSITWKAEKDGKIGFDLFGQSVGTPGASLPPGLSTIRLLARGVAARFDSLLSASVGFALELPQDGLDSIQIATGDLGTMGPAATALYEKAKRAFNLSDKFSGVLFEGAKIHWLDDHQCSSSDWPNGGIGMTAFAFSGADGDLGNWYTTFQAEMPTVPNKRYLGLFTCIRIEAMLADREVRQLQLKSRFDDLGQQFDWLKGRDAVLSFAWDSWKDSAGKSQNGTAIGMSLETTSDDVLFRLNANELGMSEDEFNAFATAVTLGPIALVDPPKAAAQDNLPPGGKRRGYFSRVRGAQAVPQLFVVASAGWLFKEAIKVREMRVVGIGLQVQPAQINDSRRGEKERETALLFDYETEFNVGVPSPQLETQRTVTARVDGTGISFESDGLTWVQVRAGLHDLALADPGLWKLGALGNILKVVEVSIRHDPTRQLVVRLHLTGDLGILTAEDFIIAIDMESGAAKVEAHPSQVTIEKKDTFKATGKLYLDTNAGSDDIRGSLDVVLTSLGWRAYAGARITHLDDGHGGKAKASLTSFLLEWPTLIPVLATGIGVKSVSGLMATHFKRKMPAESPAVPADLAWLKAAGGDVVTSVEKKDLWSPVLGASTVGLGLGLGMMTSPKVANFNAMLAVEEPGPEILIFGKLNPFKDPKPNTEEPEKLGEGILGLIKFDRPEKRFYFAALADLELNQFFHLRAPVGIAAKFDGAAAWRIWLGHFDDPIVGTLKLGPVGPINAKLWVMVAGDEMPNAPVAPGQTRTLPGLALSAGLRVHAQIGPDWLCVRGDLASYLAVSISHLMFMSGSLELGGELRLWVVSIGANGSFGTQYLTSDNPSVSALHVTGEVCGKYETFLFSISGCVRLSIGAEIVDPIAAPSLLDAVRIVGGASVALHGQGITGPIDAVIGDASTDAVNPLGDAPLDAVIALSMGSAPRVAAGGAGFVGTVARPFENMRFHLGAREGFYLLKGVSLERQANDGSWRPVDYASCPSTWWQPQKASGSDQPMPTTLALLSRSPLSTPNALPSPDQLDSWLKALLGEDICAGATPPQRCMYHPLASDRGTPPDGEWSLRADLPSEEVEKLIGRAGATSSLLDLQKRWSAGAQDDPLPGYPAFPGSCRVVADAATGEPVSFLELEARLVRDTWIASAARIAGPMAATDPMLLMLAEFTTDARQDAAISIVIETRDAGPVRVTLAKSTRQDLSDRAVQEAFHEKHPRWQPQVEAFARLAQQPRYAGYRFDVLTLDFGAALGIAATDQVEAVTVALPREGDVRRLRIDFLLGGYRFTPVAELERFANDEAHRKQTIEDLNDYLKGKPVPLLEPDSLYRVATEWDAVVGATTAGAAAHHFRTAAKPPKSAQSYLIATFPQDREKFHYATELPGFSLGSTDALRILAKFPNARLRITVNEDNGAPVRDSGDALDWHLGIPFVPEDIISATGGKAAPRGLVVEPVSGLPDALRDALSRYIKAHGEACLGPIDLPPAGLWIGLDVVLRRMSGYQVTIDLVDEAGDKIFPNNDPWLTWKFRTGLAPTLAKHVAQLGETPFRQRRLVAPLAAIPATTTVAGVSIVPDKSLEDVIAASTGDRTFKSGEAQISILWEQAGNALKASAIVLASSEPLMRVTRGVAEKEIASPDTTVRVVEAADQPLVMPDLAGSTRIAGMEVASGGCVAVARLDPAQAGDVHISLQRLVVDRLPSGNPGSETIVIPAGLLADRQMPS